MNIRRIFNTLLFCRMSKRLITEFFDVRSDLPRKKALHNPVPVQVPTKQDTTVTNYSDSLKNLMGDEWFDALDSEINKPYFKSLWSKILTERNSKKVYPPTHLVFNAFRLTPYVCYFNKISRLSKIKVVIVGQDPYHQPKQAMGLCFSVPKGVLLPPSLKNILSEIGTQSFHGDLSSWASQGVFLLNSILTVVDSQPLAHKSYGWDTFTDRVINIINETRENVVFLLWGRSAQQKCSRISNTKHFVLTCGHPSPLSIKHFKGCNHFNKCNEYLEKTEQKPIDWALPQ